MYGSELHEKLFSNGNLLKIYLNETRKAKSRKSLKLLNEPFQASFRDGSVVVHAAGTRNQIADRIMQIIVVTEALHRQLRIEKVVVRTVRLVISFGERFPGRETGEGKTKTTRNRETRILKRRVILSATFTTRFKNSDWMLDAVQKLTVRRFCLPRLAHW